MKIVKILFIICFTATYVSAASVTIQNLTLDESGAYGLFDQSGVLIDDTLTNNIRIGYFADSFDPNAAWTVGDITQLNDNFIQFGSTFGMFTGFDGAFQASTDSDPTSFAGKLITLWATDGSAFNSQSGQHLIYTFSSLTFQLEPWVGQVSLGTDSGTFLDSSGFSSGGFGNYSNDFGLGSGSLPGFNTVSPVPEPSTYALIAGIFVLGYSFVRRSRGRN